MPHGLPTRFALLITLSALIAGCTSASNPPIQPPLSVSDDLLEVAGLLRDYTVEYNRGPARLGDLAKNQPLYPRGHNAVATGQIVVVWGAKMPLNDKGAGNNVIAYEKKVLTEGGNVLLENGNVKTMTAEEFKAAPKAK